MEGEQFQHSHEPYPSQHEVQQRFGHLLMLVSEITIKADSLGMRDAQVFHSLDMPNDNTRLSVASDPRPAKDTWDQEDYLRLVVNRTVKDPFAPKEGLIFASEFLIGRQPDYKNIAVKFDFIRLIKKGDHFLAGEKMPGLIWETKSRNLAVFRGEKFKMKLPRHIESYKLRDAETIEIQIDHSQYLLDTLELLGAATEDQRTPYDS